MASGFYEVATLDETSYARVKTDNLKDFDGFMYDNQTDGGIIALFDEVKQKGKEIKDDADTIKGHYKTLQGMYETFTDYDDAMNRYASSLVTRAESIQTKIDEIITAALEKVKAAATSDDQLLDDIDALNDILGNDYDDADAQNAEWRS